MSANLDLVRSVFAAQEHGDHSSAEWAHPEIVFVIADGPSPGTWTGRAGMTEARRDWTDAWADYDAEADAFREIDDERVLVLIRRSGRGKTSGLDLGEIRTHGAALFHVHDRKVTRLVAYADRQRALADLGLKE